MKRRMLPILLSLALCLSLLPTAALAVGVEEGVPYIYYTWNNGLERHSGTVTATAVTANDTYWGNRNDDSNQEYWYVVNQDITIDENVTVYGNVHLVLQDGCSLTVTENIRVTDNGFNSGYPPGFPVEDRKKPHSLTIYGQSEGTGQLCVLGKNSGAGIGGNNFDGALAPPFGDHYDPPSERHSGAITIHGGNVTATGHDGAGIGSSGRGKAADITIYNGTVTATGGGSAGIGGGDGGRVTIYGGTVEANGGGNGAGIGGGGTDGGPQGSSGGSGGRVTIYDGTVTATGSGNGAGIGGGNYGNGGEVTIYGGTVTATGGSDAAGIGGGRFVNSQSNFSTGENGQAVIFATGGGSGSAIGDQTKRDSWSGVIFQGDGGQVYGSSITPTEDFAIGEGQILTIEQGKTLVIQEGLTLTNKGKITNNGTIIVYGTLNEEGAVDGTGDVTYEVTGVSLNKSTTTLTVGGSETLTATITPDKAASAKVTWESSDPNVATVTDGVVTAVAPGTATITATAGDISATCTVTVERPYVPPANPNYRIDVTTTEGGTVDKDPAAAKAGETVTLPPAPDAGYEVGDVTVTDRFGEAVAVTENADGTYTFTMPSGQVKVAVTFVEVQPEPLPFTDVNEGDWFHDAVRYVYDNGLMDGVGDGQFAPNATTTRAQLVTILYRLAGEQDVSGDTAFTDVAPGLWYTNAVAWAAANGIVNGVSETQFAPGNNITREQLATILYRYAESAGYDVSASADLSGFPDAGDIQSYATEALSWAVAEGLLQGFEDDSLQPQSTATRAQIATILMRFCEGVAE